MSEQNGDTASARVGSFAWTSMCSTSPTRRGPHRWRRLWAKSLVSPPRRTTRQAFGWDSASPGNRFMKAAGRSYRWIACVVLFVASALAAADPPLQSPSRFHLGGFADVELHTSSDNVREGLDLAELDLYSTAQLSNAWSGLFEVVAQRGWHKHEADDRGLRI